MVINLILYMFTLFNNTFYNAVVVVVVEGVFVKGISQWGVSILDIYIFLYHKWWVYQSNVGILPKGTRKRSKCE